MILGGRGQACLGMPKGAFNDNDNDNEKHIFGENNVQCYKRIICK